MKTIKYLYTPNDEMIYKVKGYPELEEMNLFQLLKYLELELDIVEVIYEEDVRNKNIVESLKMMLNDDVEITY